LPRSIDTPDNGFGIDKIQTSALFPPSTSSGDGVCNNFASGNTNASANQTVTMVSGYPALRCFTSTGVSCGGASSPDNANAIVVKQQATVPLFFAPILGMSTTTISASATAGRAGGSAKPADVVLILDTTASMNTSDSACSVSSATRLTCAVSGLQTLLKGFLPSQDQVALMVFPGLTSSTQPSNEYDCSSSTPSSSAIAKYSQTSPTPVYLIVPFSTDYQSSAGVLNTSSNLVKAARAGASGCTQGLSAIGGVGTYYADAVTAAQSYLTSSGRSGVAKVLVLLSDGDASASSSNISAAKLNNQCAQAVTAAAAAKTAGTSVYTIAYGASTTTSGSAASCSTDSPAISACQTLKNMASSSDNFYSDTSGTSTGGGTCSSTNSLNDLIEIFNDIGVSLSGARLLPDNTT